MGLAVLTKGPVAILIAGLAMLVYFLLNRGFKGYSIGHILTIGVASLAVIGSWFGIYILKDGWWFVNEFVAYKQLIIYHSGCRTWWAIYLPFCRVADRLFPGRYFFIPAEN